MITPLTRQHMQITHATASTPGRVNEDCVCTGGDWALVLDGATPPRDVESGCVHGVPWLVHHLAAALSARLSVPGASSLAGIVAAAIKDTCDAHAGNCDLANPDSPSSTVSVVRCGDEHLEYLVLGDSAVVAGHPGRTFTAITDDRASRLPGGRPYSNELVRANRNRTGGFWVASTDPDAAYQAVTGTVPLSKITEAALFTDGVTRLAGWYGHTWQDIFECLRTHGPASLIRRVRAAEIERPCPGAKKHDDATAVYVRSF